MELTEAEIALIIARRESEALKEQLVLNTLHILAVASDYFKWMQAEGAGSTFSTFCNDFGYEGSGRDEVYERVVEIIRVAAGEG